MPKVTPKFKKIYMEFSFTQEERDNVLKYCTLREDIKKRFRKLAAVGSLITVVFDKSEANEMLASLSQATIEVSRDTDIKKKFEDLHDRFKLKYKEVFH
jgi:uncharacterized protein YfcZ (UPF0381/DUF406 family)